MGRFISLMLALIVAVGIISVEGSGESDLSIEPSFGEIELDEAGRRLKRSIDGGVPPRWNGRGFHYAEEKPATIVVPQCHQEGRTLFQGLVNYYLQCIRNYRTGGFFRVIHICPRSKPASPKTCIPPPNCSECGK